jgi:hypothetical protein
LFADITTLTPELIAAAASDDDLFALLRSELERCLPNGRNANDEFVSELRRLPQGLRAMAATYELDVALALDDFGWHFGNWHHLGLAGETEAGLKELGATELAEVFGKPLEHARRHWQELGSKDWSKSYHGSALEAALAPLNKQAWAIHQGKPMGAGLGQVSFLDNRIAGPITSMRYKGKTNWLHCSIVCGAPRSSAAC